MARRGSSRPPNRYDTSGSRLGEPFDDVARYGEPPFTGLGTGGDGLRDAVAAVLVDEAEGGARNRQQPRSAIRPEPYG